jgi:hypothetical protein
VTPARDVAVPPIDPALFADAVLVGLAAGEQPGDGAVSAERTDSDGGVSLLQVPNSPYSRAAFALKRRFADDEALFRSALARFRALMHLFSRGVLAPWSRARAGGRSAIHPAVIDVASQMRLSDNGHFAPRKFTDAVARTARERYPRLDGWDASA